MIDAAKSYYQLHKNQVEYFQIKQKKNLDFAYKALNYSIMSAWAYTAGVLEDNKIRLNRHFDLMNSNQIDPLNASVLSKGRHKTDPQNYRGLGTRTDKKERGRLTELFYLQAENGKGINKTIVDIAIQQYHVKLANFALKEAKSKLI